MKQIIQNIEYEFRYLSKEDLPEVMQFMDQIYRSMEKKEIFSVNKMEEMESGMQRGSRLMGVYCRGQLVAFRYTEVPNWENNLGKDVTQFQIPLEKVVINDTVMVAKEHRGIKLQNITRNFILKDMAAQGYTQFMSTISPKNPDSYKNTLDSGYIIVALKKKYPDEHHPEGKDRFILYQSDEMEFISQGETVVVDFHDLEKMKELFQQGYVGVKVLPANQLLFERVIAKEKNKKLEK